LSCPSPSPRPIADRSPATIRPHKPSQTIPLSLQQHPQSPYHTHFYKKRKRLPPTRLGTVDDKTTKRRLLPSPVAPSSPGPLSGIRRKTHAFVLGGRFVLFRPKSSPPGIIVR
jgi:hypothetical protein